ncbi:MAG: hypothetical protein ACOYEO_02850 [bacterium]
MAIKTIVTDYTSPSIRETITELQTVQSTPEDIWFFSVAQNPAIELVEHKPGRKFANISNLSCFPYDPARLEGVDMQEDKRFGYYDKLFCNSRWAQEAAAQTYPHHRPRLVYTGFPLDFSRYEKYWSVPKQPNLVVFNQRFSWERLPLIEIELARRLIAQKYEVKHLFAPVAGSKVSADPRLQQLAIIAQSTGLKFIPNPTKKEYLQNLSRAAVVVTTSICDNLSVAMLEAIALGAIPVAPKAMAFPEFIHPDNLYPPYDLACIEQLVIEQPQRPHTIDQYGHELVLAKYLACMK